MSKILDTKEKSVIPLTVQTVADSSKVNMMVPRAGFERAQNGDDTKESPFLIYFDTKNQVFLQISP